MIEELAARLVSLISSLLQRKKKGRKEGRGKELPEPEPFNFSSYLWPKPGGRNASGVGAAKAEIIDTM